VPHSRDKQNDTCDVEENSQPIRLPDCGAHKSRTPRVNVRRFDPRLLFVILPLAQADQKDTRGQKLELGVGESPNFKKECAHEKYAADVKKCLIPRIDCKRFKKAAEINSHVYRVNDLTLDVKTNAIDNATMGAS
jgi:hypothetical protein